MPAVCADCGQPLLPVGQGTERVEETLERLFPDAPLARLDRDTAGASGAMQAVLDRVHRRRGAHPRRHADAHQGPSFSGREPGGDSGCRSGPCSPATFARPSGWRRPSRRWPAAPGAPRGRRGDGSDRVPRASAAHRLLAEGYEAIRGRPRSRSAGRRAGRRTRGSRCCAPRRRTGWRLDAFLRAAAASCARTLPTAPCKVLGPAAALIARRADHFRAHLLIESAVARRRCSAF